MFVKLMIDRTNCFIQCDTGLILFVILVVTFTVRLCSTQLKSDFAVEIFIVRDHGEI